MPLDSKKLKEVQERLDAIRDAGIEASFAFKDMSQQIGQIAKNSGDLRESIVASGKAAKDLVKESNELAKFTTADLSNKNQAAKFETHSINLAKKRAKIESQIRVLNVIKVNATEEEARNIEKTVNILQDGLTRSSMISDEFDNINKANKELNSNTKFFDKMGETLKTIPGIGPLISGPFEKAGKVMREARAKNESFLKSAGRGVLELGKAFGPAYLLGSIIKADSHMIEMQRSLQLTHEEARELHHQHTAIAIASGNALHNQKNLLEATKQLSTEMGVTSGFSEDMVKNQAFLTKRLGINEKLSAKFAKYQASTGKSAKVTNLEIADSVANLRKETGISVKLSEVFEDVANTTAGLKAAYGFNNKLLAQQVLKTKQLGINMAQAEKIASGMLDFESSIQSELEAELLTGKNLNLEKARSLALSGKSSEAAAEILNQVGSSNDLAKMNVIQQEALAKAVGMERNELIASVKEREVLAKLGGESLETQLKEAKTDEARAEIKKKFLEGGGEELLQAYERESAAERFEAVMIKVQSAISGIADYLSPVIGFFADIFNSAAGIYTILGAIGAIMITSLVSYVNKFLIFWGIRKANETSSLITKGEENALDTAANTLQGTKNTLLAAQLTTEAAITAEKIAQNAATGVGITEETTKEGIMASQAVTQTVQTAQKGAGNIAAGAGIAAESTKATLMAGQAAAATTVNAMSTFGIGTVIAVGAVTAALAALGTYMFMKDGVIGPGGEMVVSGPKGSIQLDKDDSIIAGTNLGGKGKGGSSKNNINIQPIVAAINAQNAILNQIASKSTVIEMGGNEVGQGINTAEREIQ